VGNFFKHNQPVLKKLAIGTLVLLLIFFTSLDTLNAQCPQINPDMVEIEVDQSKDQININSLADIDFRSFSLSLYNMDNGSYYYDSEGKKTVIDGKKPSFNIKSNKLIIRNLSPGDYVIIIEKSGCEKQIIGWGYSGLPHSAIRIQ
jgi:hypothetical protein